MLPSRGPSVLTYPELMPSIFECGRSSRSRTERGYHVARLPDTRCALHDHERCAYVAGRMRCSPRHYRMAAWAHRKRERMIRRNRQSPAMPSGAPRRHLVHLSALQLTMVASTARRKAFLLGISVGGLEGDQWKERFRETSNNNFDEPHTGSWDNEG